MTLPTGARRTDGTVRFGYIIVALLTISLILAVWHAPVAAALSLPSVSVNLPVSDTALAPITNTLDDVTSKLPVPIALQNTPSTVGADIDTGISLPLLSDSPSSLAAPLRIATDVSLPSVVPETLNSIVPAVTDTARQVAPLTTTVLPPATPIVTPTNQSSAVSTTQNNINAISSQINKTDAITGNEEKSVAATVLDPVLTGVANFFGSTIPSAFQNVIRGFTAKEIDTFPIIVSGIIFIVMMAIIIGITYIMNSRGIISMGNTRLGQLVQSYDLTQISILVVVSIGAGVIAIYLATAQH